MYPMLDFYCYEFQMLHDHEHLAANLSSEADRNTIRFNRLASWMRGRVEAIRQIRS